MKRLAWLTPALALALAACHQQKEEEVGRISLALQSADSGGTNYRLRNATIEIVGHPDGFGGWFDAGPAEPPFREVVSTEANPNAAAITRRVPPGSYTVSLRGDWHLERIGPAGVERVAQVVLLSPASQHTWVGDGGTTHVAYQFGVDGTLIDFRSGDLSIGVEVVKPGERPRVDAGWSF